MNKRGDDGGSEGCKCRRVSNRGSECESCPRGEILLSFMGLVMRKRWRCWGGGQGEDTAALALEVSLLHCVTIVYTSCLYRPIPPPHFNPCCLMEHFSM